jgi:hypothetical protein
MTHHPHPYPHPHGETSQVARLTEILRERTAILAQIMDDRAAIVAYLRRRGGAADDYADDIEKGEHLLDWEGL